MNVRFLETFLWVARLRSFSAAAVRLNATQAAVSNRIATLERDLGTRLFERDLRNVRLTAPGRLLLERATDIVRLTNEVRDIAGEAHRVRTAVSIGTIDMIAHAWLPLLIDKMKTDYPGISLSLSVDSSLDIAHRVRAGELDLGFAMGPVMDDSLVNLDLGQFECCWVAAPDATIPDGPIELRALTSTPLLTHSRGSLPHHALLRLLDKAGIDRAAARIYNCNSVATIMQMVRDRVGTACLPQVIVREALERGALRRLDVAFPLPPLRFHAIYANQKSNPVPTLIAALAIAVANGFCSAEADRNERTEDLAISEGLRVGQRR